MSNSVQLNKLLGETLELSKDVLKIINNIIDEKSFVEMDTFIRSQTALGEAAGEGVVSGFASISDIQVGIFATNPTVLKGSIGKANSQKIVRCVEKAVITNSPIIAILDTYGARFAEGIEAMEGYGAILNAFSNAYGIVPTIIVVKGSNLGMLSYLTTCCDCCIAYDKAVIATASPLVLAAKNKLDTKDIGNSAIHSATTGIISNIVKTDAELKDYIAKFLDLLCNKISVSSDDANRICKNLKAKTKAADIINEIIDKGSFCELKTNFAKEVITGIAKLNGISVGIACNNGEINEGRLTANAAIKVSDLLNMCDSFDIPVINMVDCGGVEVNLVGENSNLIREISNLIYCYNQITVGKISLVTGNAIGLGYVALASKAVYDFTFAWADANIGIIDNLAAAELIYSAEISKAKDKDKAAQKLADSYAEANSNAITVAMNGYIDNVFEPNLSRQYLINALQMLVAKR